MILLLKIASKGSFEMLSNVSKVEEKCDVPYGENMCVRLASFSHELYNINESTIYIWGY